MLLYLTNKQWLEYSIKRDQEWTNFLKIAEKKRGSIFHFMEIISLRNQWFHKNPLPVIKIIDNE
jgi:hypothetical protein